MTVIRTLIVPASDADLARSIADTIDPADYSGMFLTPLTEDGETISHYITSGPVSDGFAALVPCATWEQQEGEWVQTDYYPGDPIAAALLCQQADPPLDVTDADVEAVWLAADVSEQDPFVAMGRLGLVLYQEPMNG